MKTTNNGPVFESGPGWGEQLSEWTKQNLLYVIPAVIIVVVAIVMIASDDSDNQTALVSPSITASSEPTAPPLTQTAQKGDSYTTIARRAVGFTHMTSSHFIPRGADLYAETKLAKDIQNQPLNVGSTITYDIGLIWKYFDEYEHLTAKQKASWEAYAKKAGI